jgi:hypothetical protein
MRVQDQAENFEEESKLAAERPIQNRRKEGVEVGDCVGLESPERVDFRLQHIQLRHDAMLFIQWRQRKFHIAEKGCVVTRASCATNLAEHLFLNGMCPPKGGECKTVDHSALVKPHPEEMACHQPASAMLWDQADLSERRTGTGEKQVPRFQGVTGESSRFLRRHVVKSVEPQPVGPNVADVQNWHSSVYELRSVELSTEWSSLYGIFTVRAKRSELGLRIMALYRSPRS